MAQEGIAAALTIPDDIMGRLEQAQKIVDQMAVSADKIGAGFKTAATSLTSAFNAVGPRNFNAAFNTTGAIANLQALSDTTVQLNKNQSAAANGAKELDKALRMNETKGMGAIKAKMEAIEKALAAPGASAEKVSAARAKLEELRKTYEGLQGDAQKSLDAIKQGLASMDTSGNIEKMRARLQTLKETLRQLKALEKQGFAIPVGSIQATQNAINALNQRISATNALMGMTAKNANMLRGMLSMVFNPIMITSFLKNLVAIRGEFEIAQKSLAVLIQSEGMAADMFNEISRIAVKSPFSVMEMTKQVKQLAAYRIENEKLISTTKMLGDISAGVGVDMNRLILAYGQVKAATFLKGQELRQFSEAGVNMLGGLADRFSELYNRVVTTGEVLQMVSKRMVKFADVDAVLRKQTSEGGAFYKMQEKQAETLKGMVVNLQDRIQLMFNQTGTQFDTLMKKVVKGIEWIISHGRLVSNIVMPLLTMKVVTGLFGLILNGNLAKGFLNVALAARAMKKELDAGAALAVSFGTKAASGIKVFASALGSIGWGTVIGAILAITAAIAMWAKNANAFNDELEKIAKKANTASAESIENYTRLVDKATDATEKEKDRVAAIEELKKQYGNILPIQDLELSNVQKLNDARQEQIELIRSQILMEARADAMRAATKKIDEKASVRSRRLINDLQKVAVTGRNLSGDDVTFGDFGFIQKFSEGIKGLSETTKSEVDSIRQSIDQRIINGTITDATKARDEFLKGILVRSGATAKQVSQIIGSLSESDFEGITKQFQPVFDVLEKANLIISSHTIDTSISRYLEDYKKAISGLSNARKEFMNSLSTEQEEYYKINPAQMDLDVEKYVRQQKNKIVDIIQNENYGEIGEETKKQLLGELDKAFAKDGGESPIKRWFNEQLALVNDAFPNMVKKLGVGELALKEGESLESFSKKATESLDKVQRALKVMQSPKRTRGQFLELAQEWGGDAYKAFSELEEKIENVEARTDVSMEKTYQLTTLKQEQANVEKDLDATITKNLEDQISGTNQILTALGKYLNARAEAANATAYKQQLKTFVSDVKNASKEFDKLDDQGDALLRKKLEASAKSLNIKLPETLDGKTFDAWFKTIEDKLPEKEVIDLKLTFNKNDTADAIKKLSDDAAALWDKYDNAKKLEGWGLSFVGASSASIMRDLEDIESQLRAKNTEDSIAQANQIKEKRLQILRSEQEEAARLMYEAQKKALNKTEQAYQDMYDNITKIRAQKGKVIDGVKITDEQVDAAVAAKIAKSMKEVANAEWDAYKSTEMYAMAFGDLKGMSLDVLTMLKEKLVQFKSMEGLDPADIQAVERAIVKLNRQMATVKGSDTFIGQLKEAFNAARDFRNSIEDGEIKTAQEEMIADQTALRKAKQLVEDLEYQRNVIGENAVSTEELAEAKQRLAAAEDKAQKSSQRYNSLLQDGRDRIAAAKDAVDKTSSVYGKITGEINEVIGAVKEVADAIGGDLGPEAEGVLEGIQQGFKLGGTAISIAATAMEIYLMVTEAETTAMTKLMTVMWPLLAVAGALAVAFAVIKGRDKALEKQIEDSKYAVERLKVAYDELERSMNKAMDLRRSAQFHDQMIRNLNQQIAKLQEAKALEEQRKSRGGKREEALDEFNDQIAELKNSIEDTKDEWLEFMGSFSDSRNEAKSWASNWLDAFKDAKNGVKSLTDSFDDMYEEIVATQLSDVLQPQIEELKGLISNAVSDGYLTESEAAAILAQRQILANTSDNLRKRAEELGIRVGGEGGMNTLQKGIESVTEQTAQAIESYLNSTRAFVADNNRILLQWDEFMMNPENENSILSNIRTQTRYLRTLSSIAQAVYSPGSTGQGAGGIKVFVMG